MPWLCLADSACERFKITDKTSSVFYVQSTSNSLYCTELFVLRAFLSNVVFAFVQRHGSHVTYWPGLRLSWPRWNEFLAILTSGLQCEDFAAPFSTRDMNFIPLALFHFYVESVSDIIINCESTRCENVTSFKECALIPNLDLQNGVFCMQFLTKSRT
jgi:hypothetical protein